MDLLSFIIGQYYLLLLDDIIFYYISGVLKIREFSQHVYILNVINVSGLFICIVRKYAYFIIQIFVTCSLQVYYGIW